MSYTGIRFYKRDKKEWGPFLTIRVGFDASFVLDKTTDSANVTVGTSNEPTWVGIHTWVALFIQADSTELEFNADGTPKNHEQFIVGAYQWQKTIAGYETQLKLIEPIERFRGVMGETLSYTSQTQKTQDGITYYKEPYNYYSALKRWLQVTPSNTDLFGASGEDRTKTGRAWWNRIRIIDVDFLKNIPFADDTLNEMSLYDVLFNVYDSGTGRTPVAFFDLDVNTGLPKNLDRDEYLLKFIPQDGLDKPIVQYDDLVANKGKGEVCTAIMKREDGANYATGLVSNVTNLSPNTTVTFPAQGVYALPESADENIRDTTHLTARGTGQWVLRLPHKIKTVKKLIELRLIGSLNGDSSYSRIEKTERKVLEKHQKIAETDISDTSIDYYNEGTNLIYLSNYAYVSIFESTTDDEGAYLYYIEYEPLIDARIMVGGDEYVQQINQTSSQVDSEKFGKFMIDYLAGMAKADYTIQRTTVHPQKYLDYFGRRVNHDDKTYTITNVALRNRNLQYDVFFQLNENHVRKNISYQAPQNIRTNTSIQYDNILDRKTVIKDRLICSLEKKAIKTPQYLNKKYKVAVFNALLPHSIFTPDLPEDYYPQFANIQINDIPQSDRWRSANIAPFLFGNNICYNVQFPNNAISGRTKITNNNLFVGVEQQTPVLYTDAFGELDKTTIDIISANVKKPVINEDRYSADAFYEARDFQSVAQSVQVWAISEKEKIISIPKINLQKDMLEMYNITYSLEVGGQDITVYPEMLEYSRFYNQTAVCKNLHFIGYDGYDGTGKIIAEADVDYKKAYYDKNDNAIVFQYPLEDAKAEKEAKSILVQSIIDDKTINCLMINNFKKYSLTGHSIIKIYF